MGCFGSRSSKSDEETQMVSLISDNLKKLSQPPPPRWNQQTMKPLSFSISHSPIKRLLPSQGEELKNLNFPVFSKSRELLKEYLFLILSNRFLSAPNLQNLIEVISINYQENPFHNFTHGFSICQMLYVISERNSKLESFLTENDERLLLLSGLGHDLNHPGVNNPFMINSKHEIAIKYNNSAVLENYHASTLVEFINSSNFGLPMSNEDKQTIILTILGTDMAQHKSVMEVFEENMKNFDKNNSSHRISVMRMLIHGADVGNPALNFELATLWSLKIIQEFNMQVWKEEQLGIQVSEFMRIGDDLGKIKKSQTGFIDFFILPLWKMISDYIPNTTELADNIERNRKNWDELQSLS